MDGSLARHGSDSRACQPRTVPLTWFDSVDKAHPSVSAFEQWLDGLTPFERLHQQGEIDDLFAAASRGALEDTGDERTPIKPIFKDPEVFELRRKALTNALRFYHGEPENYPSHLIALHRHIKTGKESQQREILYAVTRYRTRTSE